MDPPKMEDIIYGIKTCNDKVQVCIMSFMILFHLKKLCIKWIHQNGRYSPLHRQTNNKYLVHVYLSFSFGDYCVSALFLLVCSE